MSRVVTENIEFEKLIDANEKFNKYYDKWLDDWLKDYKLIIEKESKMVFININNWSLEEYDTYNNENHINLTKYHSVKITHNDNDENISIRNQGIAGIEYFNINDQGKIGELKCANDKIKQKEIIEVIGTKIVSIDDRVFNYLLDINKNEKLEKDLFLKAFSEGKNISDIESKLNCLKNLQFLPVHFLIIHLSFIYKIMKDDIINFINENLKNDLDEYIFKKLVITTGRGRSGWYSKIKNNKELRTKVIFISPESLTSAISYGISIKDEFEIKYRLVKLLMN